ncbi:lysozyme [Chitinibacter tainanensis]|uniref:lysozyme n=1 Tax=Chitinibacter tainanensis TaxID=230667 RepID=UPI0003FFD549|nr:lysozyme [Chitinibacter tainanensis]
MASTAMRTGQRGRAIIKKFEQSDQVALKPYKCPAGYWTIGWGHKIEAGDEWMMKGITAAQAEEIFDKDLLRIEKAVLKLVRVPLNQNQFDAIVSFTFNVGPDIDQDNIAEGLGDSTLLRHLNSGNYYKAAEEFNKWVFAMGKRQPGLVRRRTAERQLFLLPV